MNTETLGIKFEIETKRQDLQDIQQQFSVLTMEYAENPGAWGPGGYPALLDSRFSDSYPSQIELLKDEVESLRNIMRSKL